jgi:GNAT superfamily N-acetyltransferase
VTEDVRRAFAFMARADGAGTRTEPFAFGTATFDEELALRHDSNYLLVEQGTPSPSELVAEADRLQGEAGLAHRAIVVPEEQLGSRLAPEFRARAWLVQRQVVMVHRREPDRSADTASVDEVDEQALRPGRTRLTLTYPWGSEELARVLLDAKPRIANRVRARFFAWLEGGEPVSWTDLYSADRVAQIEDVATLPEHRGRGLATAVVLRALEEARAEGNEFVFLVANDEDWPKQIYARLGFDEAGHYFKFVRAGA